VTFIQRILLEIQLKDGLYHLGKFFVGLKAGAQIGGTVRRAKPKTNCGEVK